MLPCKHADGRLLPGVQIRGGSELAAEVDAHLVGPANLDERPGALARLDRGGRGRLAELAQPMAEGHRADPDATDGGRKLRRRTQIATEQLQTAQGLTPDGIVGASTRRALRRALTGTKPASTTSPSGTTLKLGDTGSAVVSWQNQLNQWLKLTSPTQTPLTADGNFGTATQTATEQLQTAAGLTPTGEVDAATRRALNSALATSNQNTG